MPTPVRRAPALAFLLTAALALVGGGGPARMVHAQPGPKPAEPIPAVPPTDPTPEALKAVTEAFRTEREAALKAQFSADSLARADDLARRAEVAIKEGNPRAAIRYYREARWRLPYLPVNLPPHVIRVLGESRMRHGSDRANPGVYAIAYSPDGATLVSAARDFTAKIWDLGNGRELVTYRGHASQPEATSKDSTSVLGVSGVAYHPNGKMVASAAGSQVHLWDPATGVQIKVLSRIEATDRPFKSIAFRPDGAALAVGSDDGILRVYEVATGKETFKSAPRNARIERVAYSPNGKLIGVADANGMAAVYAPAAPAANTMPMSTGVQNPAGGVCSGVGFTSDSGAIFTCGADGKARLTAGPNPDGSATTTTTTQLREYTGHTGPVIDLAVTADGKSLITGGDDKTVRVWDVTTGRQVRAFQGHSTRVLAVTIRSDGRQIASAGEDGAIRLWDLSPGDDHRILTGATGPIWAVAVSPDGKRAAAAGADRTIRVYDPNTGVLEASLTGHKAAITSLAFFPDSNRLVSAGGDRIIRIWDVAARKVVKELSGHESAVLTVAVNPDGKQIVSGAADRTARGWEPDSGKTVWTWTGRTVVTAVAVRGRSNQVAIGMADGTLVMLDVSSGTPRELSSLPAHAAGLASLSFSPDGGKLASGGGDGVVRVWTFPETGPPAELHRFEGQAKQGAASGFSPVSAVAFSPDGRFIASAGADAVIRVFDVHTKAEVRGLRGHTDWATAVAFAPDSRLLVSAGVDKSVRVFELIPQEGAVTVGHLRAVNATAISPDGKTAATASEDNTIKLWDLASGKEIGTLIGSDDKPYSVTFLGADVVMGGVPQQENGRIHFWDTTPPRLRATVVTGEVYTVASDGSRLAAWSARTIVEEKNKQSIYEVFDRNGKPLISLADKGRNVKSGAFSLDLTWVAAGDDTGSVQIWDLEKKEKVGDLWQMFDNRSIGDLGLTPDKKYLVAVDATGLLKLADVAKRHTLASAPSHAAGASGLLVSPKGDTLITIGAEREIKAWSLADPNVLKEVRSWTFATEIRGAAYSPDGKTVITANADGTAYVLEMP